MRAIMTSLALTFALGALTMSDATAVADEKKDEKWEKKPSAKKEDFDEKVTVKKNVGTVKAPKLPKAVPDVLAVRSSIGDKNVIYTFQPAGDTETPPGSEIILADGTVYTVTDSKAVGGGNFAKHLNYVTKKPAEKKP